MSLRADADGDVKREGTGPWPVTLSAVPVGRLVECSLSDDRRLINLVKQRTPLYARGNMPVASHYRQVKLLWMQVAEEMGTDVAEVRRKWSHIRNSYSRQLRNELQGACTAKGRVVSRWHLADELEFLRPHMATDRRASGSGGDYPWAKPAGRPWAAPSPPTAPLTIKQETDHEPELDAETQPRPDDDTSSSFTFDSDENEAYFEFFRGIFNDYRELAPRKQRLFRRQCLHLLHQLLDESEDPLQPSFEVCVLPGLEHCGPSAP